MTTKYESVTETESKQVGGSLPVAEIFESVQGEGAQLGMATTFIRLAGCTVGKPYTPAARENLGIESYQERCTSWDGNSFPCDTNYRMSQRMTVEQLLADVMVYRARWVSITGGEPLMHNIYPLINELLCSDDKRGVHIETSGTIMFDRSQVHQKYITDRLWLTVSPKHHTLEGMLRQADEIRVMVDRSFTEENFLAVFGKYIDSGKLWISPVNDLVSLNYDNLQTCLALQHKYRQLRLTTQLHKTWSVR